MFGLKNFFAAVLMIFAVMFFGTAEAGIITDRLPFQCYVDHQVSTYNQPNGRIVGYISANDDLVRVTQVRSDGWAYGDYPISGGRRVARWFRVSELCADPGYSNRGTKVQGTQRVFRTKDSSQALGSVSHNEDVIVLADNGNRAQILYKLDNGNGYKVGWIPSSSVSSRANIPSGMPQNPIVTRSNFNYYQPADSEYYIVPANNGGFAIDVPNNWTNEGTVLQIYGRNNSPAQTFRLQRVNGDWYKIVHTTSGHVLNVQGGSRSNGTRLWLYHYDGTASCHWRFRDLGNGIYNIESELASNPFLEVQNGNPFNDAILQLWQQHSGDAAKWKLVKVNTYVYPVEGNYSLTTLFYYNSIVKSLGHRHSVWWHKPVSEGGHFNSLDIACSNGTPVKAVAAGRVTNEFANSGSNIIVIEHNDSKIGKSLYAHLSEKLVYPGNTVSAGQIIGKSGNAGVGPGNYHLHLEWFNSSPWEYYRDKVPFQYHTSTESAYNKWCLAEDRQRFSEAIKWIKNYGGGFH